MQEKCLFAVTTIAAKSVCGASRPKDIYTRVPSPTNESSKWRAAKVTALSLQVFIIVMIMYVLYVIMFFKGCFKKISRYDFVDILYIICTTTEKRINTVVVKTY